MKKIRKLLIANRGEIAVRVIHAAKELGIQTVAVFADSDRCAIHVMKADEAYHLIHRGIEPYLDMDQILDFAELAEADAIHPGYGFLSENSIFARETTIRGFTFIGPSDETISLMGDKLRAKAIATQAHVPVIPGFDIENEITSAQLEQAKSIGFPLLIKARAGGGGKGMRIVREEKEVREAILSAASEAKEAFGDGRIFIEKLIVNPRHIEIQILADSHGNAVHLFERECSIQRRHQKIIEEAPSSVLDESLRQQMGEAAISLVNICGYTNAGTVEFILDEDKKFYFLEMNTRLQVEHPVTEFITGLDLVKEQINIAEGGKLPFTQSDLQISGHAIELRVYAEDPRNSFYPDIGDLLTYKPPKGIGVRVDDGIEQGMEIPMEYDPLIAKLIVHGRTREEAIIRMKRAIGDYEIEGVGNTLEFGAWVMSDRDFQDGNFHTGFVEKKMDKFMLASGDETEAKIAAMACLEIIDNYNSPKKNIVPILQSKWRDRLK